MQETFDSKSVSPPGMKDDERREILAHLEKIMPQHTGKPAGANDSFSLKDLEDLAKWERFRRPCHAPFRPGPCARSAHA